MHVVERGSGDPLVLFHGFGVDHRLLLALDSSFEFAGQWRRLYFDLPGHGLSAAEDVSTAEDVVAEVEAEVRSRLGESPFAVVGNSFGGMIARRVAHDFREQVLGLALIAPVMVAEHSRRRAPEQIILSADSTLIESLGEAGELYAEVAVVQSPENSEAFLEHAFPGLSCADEDAMERISQRYALDEEPEIASPEPFIQPSLFITARQDQVVGYQDAWFQMEHYPRATFATLDAAGHNVHLDQPAITHALIAEWLQRMRAE